MHCKPSCNLACDNRKICLHHANSYAQDTLSSSGTQHLFGIICELLDSACLSDLFQAALRPETRQPR